MSLHRVTQVVVACAWLAPLGCSSAPVAPHSSDGGAQASSSAPAVMTVDGVMSALPSSCAFTCDACAETTKPFACPALKPWADVPHDAACGSWDGTYPAITAGKCAASDPTGEAALPTGPLAGGGLVLPDGHRVHPVGREVTFDEADLMGGFPMSIQAIAGTRLALVSDGGIVNNALRLIDLDALAAGGVAAPSHVAFPEPSSLFYGMAVLPDGKVLASGGGDGVIYAFDVDTSQKTIARAAARDINLGGNTATFYAGAIATTLDGSRLLVAPSANVSSIRVLSLGAADYGTKLNDIVIGSENVFDLRLDPYDPAGTTFYATDQAGSRLLEIDAAKGTATRTVALGKNPAQMVFLDATYMIVAATDSDNLLIVDRAIGAVVATTQVFEKDAPHGFSPTALAYDATAMRLYAVLAGVNAVEVYNVTMGTPPTIAPEGRLSTGFWPTGVIVNNDGSLTVINGKGQGTGPYDTRLSWDDSVITKRMHGSIQSVPASALLDLKHATADVDAGHRIADLPGHAAVTCPEGAADFPIPKSNTSGPSTQIKHVILVVRENKTYDAVFGDRIDLGNGDPALIMASDPLVQSKVWQNARSIASSFTNFDNFYTDAEQSIQGHTWTVFGRTTDFMERTWLTIWGRATRSIATTTSTTDMPLEGGIFSWLSDNKIGFTDMGEVTGNLGFDLDYPGFLYAAGVPDTEKSCYLAGNIRLRCDLAPFTYVVQPNDHTFGGQAGRPAPEVMVSVNDEASGMLIDAISHSPTWKDSLVIITEDDPQDGGDHVDLHRTVLLMASPWVRRGYVSHGHYDMASVYKLVAHLFGIPYHNETIRTAMVPFDAFTSTPDYSPFTYLPRKVTAPCNAVRTREAREAERWDFTDPDDQPGLSDQIVRMMRMPATERGVRVLP